MSSIAEPMPASGITRVSVTGFKSLRDETTIDIRPLTVLAGANSSGKSSVLQPILLLKQTLETTFDPGVLFLAGEHLNFSDFNQTLWRGAGPPSRSFTLRAELGGERWASLTFFKNTDGTSALDRAESGPTGAPADVVWTAGLRQIPISLLVESGHLDRGVGDKGSLALRLERWLPWLSSNRGGLPWLLGRGGALRIATEIPFPGLGALHDQVGRLIHVRAVRDRPTRDYPTTQFDQRFIGPFEPYVASLIAAWEADPRGDRLDKALKSLGLSAAVRSRRKADGRFEMRVARLPSGDNIAFDFDVDGVDLADVGMGVSQVLPVLVAILAGSRDRLVYIEEPELHLHPRAQAALAAVIVEAIDAGARIVIETHSSILLLSLQTLVAQGQIASDQIALHWFNRDAEGATHVTRGSLDDAGAFGDWPVDFTEIEMDAQLAYIKATTPGGG